MQHPTVKNDGESEIKSITATSVEAEWSRTKWVGLEVNTGGEGSFEQLAENNLNELGYAKEFVVFYRPDKPDLSLLHLILNKMPGWSVDDADIDRILWNKRMRIEMTNTNLYNLLTTIVAPKIGCVILFDILNFKIKAIAKENLDSYTYDTNIFISHRNLAKEINVRVNENSVFTRLNCQGDGGLNFKDVNYNDAYIVDYSYFMREPYMDTALADKITTWKTWRDDNQDDFMALSKQRADTNDKIYDIQYRVPNDGTDWSQWDAMEEDLLNQNLKYYNALLTSLQVSVDENPQYDSEGDYIPWKKQDGTVDHDAYLALLHEQANGYGGYYTYFEILNYIIPNIQTAIENLGLPDDQKHDYNKEYETNWDLYGIEELEGKKKNYEGQLKTLSNYSKPWSEMTAEEKALYLNDEDMYNANGRTKYVTISGYLGSETTSGSLLYTLKALKDELSTLETSLDNIDTERAEMINKAKIDNAEWNLTKKELEIIARLTIDTDYTNNNIITTSLDTTITRIDREMELYENSLDKLSEVCQPQLDFSVELDNLLDIEVFSGWMNDFKLLNFFRLGLRDDYSVKLRMVKYIYNPCEKGEDLVIEFSSFITSRSGRSDLTDLIQNSGGGTVQEGAITYGTGDSSSELEYMTSLLEAMTKTNLFKSSVTNIASGVVVTGDTPIDQAQIASLVSGYISTAKIDVDQITGKEAAFQELSATYIDSEYIVAGVLDADAVKTRDLSAKLITTDQIVASLVSGTEGSFDTLTANTAFMQYLNTNLVQAAEINVTKLKAALGQIQTLEAGTAFVQYLQGLSASVATSTIDAAYIKQAVIANVTVGELQAGSIILSDDMTIGSENGKLSMDGSALQIYGKDKQGNDYVAIQLGYDASSNPSLIVRNEQGATILTPTGITSDAVADDLIVERMLDDGSVTNGKIGDKAVSKDKLSFAIIEPNDQGGIDITNVYDGHGNKWGIQYDKFVGDTNSSISTINSTVDTLEGTISQKVAQTDFDTYQGTVSDRFTTVTQNLNSINSRVQVVESNDTKQTEDIADVATKYSTLSQTVDSFKTEVSSTYATKGALSSARTLIEQNASNIALKVDKDGVISSINASPETITISADKIDLVGNVSFSMFDNGTQSKITNIETQSGNNASTISSWASGQNVTTTISGASITTGSITSAQLSTDAIKSNNYTPSDSSLFPVRGSYLNLTDGSFYTPNFYADYATGKAAFNGKVEADEGKFGNEDSYWNISTLYDYTGNSHSALVGVGDPYIQTGNWQVSSNAVATRKYEYDAQSTTEGTASYYKDSTNNIYYDVGMEIPTDFTAVTGSESNVQRYRKSFFYGRKGTVADTIPSVDADWQYMFMVDTEGNIYTNGTVYASGTIYEKGKPLSERYVNKSGDDGNFLPLTGGTITGNLTVQGNLTATASSAKALDATGLITVALGSESGAIYTGSSASTPGVSGILPVTHGGTGQSDAWSALNAFINSATVATTTPVDKDYFISQYVNGGTTDTRYYRRSFSTLWKYVKGKIDSVYDLDNTYRKIDDNIFDTANVTDLTAGNLVVTGVGRFTDGIYGNLKGNADTATKATQDGSGNVIADTYVKKAGDTMTGDLVIRKDTTIEENEPATLRFVSYQTDNGLSSNAYIEVYDDHDALTNGTNMVIRSNGNVFIGGGESPSTLYKLNADSTSERLYLVSDNVIFMEANAQTLANRIGFLMNGSHQILPTKAGVETNNIGSIGSADKKWANVYATNLHGNADTATSAGKWTSAISLGIGNSTKFVDGSANVSFSRAEISDVAQPATNDTGFTANAGWMSGADKAKLDSITVTSGGSIATKNITVERGLSNTSQTEGVYVIGHANSITQGTAQGTADGTALTNGGQLKIPKVSYNAFGHITSAGVNTLTLPSYSNASETNDGFMTSTDKKKLNNINIAYATCSTAADEAEKIIDIEGDGDWSLTTGSIIGVKFAVSNTASNVTFNVDGTGAKPLYFNTAVYTGKTAYVTGYANRITYYMYNGTHWVWMSHSTDNNDNYVPTAYCATAAGTAAKGATCTNFKLLAKSHTFLLLSNANTASSALTLNINSTGAKPLYINGTASSASNHTLPAGSYHCYYDGTNYYVRTDGKITGDITGNAETANSALTADSATTANSATKATQDGSGNVITSTYVNLTGTQTVSGAKTFSAVTSFTNTTASTSKTTGAVKVSGGVGVAGRMSANEVEVNNGCVLQYDETKSCLNFYFN